MRARCVTSYRLILPITMIGELICQPHATEQCIAGKFSPFAALLTFLQGPYIKGRRGSLNPIFETNSTGTVLRSAGQVQQPMLHLLPLGRESRRICCR